MLFSELKKYAEENNLKYLIDGTNFDDLSVYRPGLQALKEMSVSTSKNCREPRTSLL